MNTSTPASSLPLLVRHEFLIRRLHSLSGLIPVGAYMVVHLLVNASILDSPASFQRNVYQIHSLGRVLWLVEWLFIFIPILFHAILGVVIIRGGLPNTGNYPYAGNIRYTLQRATGMIAFAYIVWHVFHMHGWFHVDSWLRSVAEPLYGARFKAFNAASTAGAAIQQSLLVSVLYAVGVVACVYHLANGIWTMGITWGVWTSPAAQRRANNVCVAGGVVLGLIGLGALWGMQTVDVNEARRIEDAMYEARTAAGDIAPNPHKRWPSSEGAGEELHAAGGLPRTRPK